MEQGIKVPVLFAKAGWMEFYSGPRPDDPKPIGGGLHNKRNFGHEGFNFRRHDNQLFGFSTQGKLDLQRIDRFALGNRIRGATVIFVATDPKFHGQRIIGWYRNATIYAERVQYPQAVAEQMNSEVNLHFANMGYQFEGVVDDAVLLPLSQRRLQRIKIPKRNGVGQASVCYPLTKDGNANPETLKWIRKALDYVDSYSGPNLLEDDGIQDEVADAVVVASEKSDGFQSDPRIRRRIEEYAMECARAYFVRRKYKDVTRTDDRHCYDYTCKDRGKTIYVEVKGTQTQGEKVTITKNEKAHVEASSDTILYIRHSVNVSRGKRVCVSGGSEKVLDRWDPQAGSFSPVAYIYTLPTG